MSPSDVAAGVVVGQRTFLRGGTHRLTIAVKPIGNGVLLHLNAGDQRPGYETKILLRAPEAERLASLMLAAVRAG
jgi:hypothetical protein